MNYHSPSTGRQRSAPTTNGQHPVRRVRILYACLVAALLIFGLRLFYVQIIQYGYYRQAALSDQLKQYEIPATRGIIEVHDGSSIVPIVLNQELFTLYADPTFVTDPETTAAKLVAITGGDAQKYADLMRTPNTRYVILAKKLSDDVSKRILDLKLPGVGTQGQDYRTYPQGKLASQLLGFVDASGTGQYGLEQALNKQLTGKPGQVKAVTDVNGVPLPATKGNVDTVPVGGDTVVTTLDLSMQAQMEQILRREAGATHSKQLSAIILDANNGQVKAMANYPTYDPANYQKVSDPALFQNAVVANAIEPGSIMKTLTVASSLDQGIITPGTTFYDPAHWMIDGHNITDVEEDGGPGRQSIESLLSLSLNTGATWLLMQMSHQGGTEINQQGIGTWHDYLTKHFHFGEYTGIEQGYESAGLVPGLDVAAPKLAFATTSFGQGIQLTALQMASAVASVVNGGTLYQPTLVDRMIDQAGKVTVNPTKVAAHNVVKPNVSKQLLPLLETVVSIKVQQGFAYMAFPSNYIVGGKTGTAQIAEPGGGYYPDSYNGTYVGFVGGDKPQYVICVFNIEPHVDGYAGAHAGQPVFADLAHMLINSSFVMPKTR